MVMLTPLWEDESGHLVHIKDSGLATLSGGQVTYDGEVVEGTTFYPSRDSHEDISLLPQVFIGILGRPSLESWRQDAWSLYGAVNGFLPEDIDDEPGGVTREDFEENLRAYNAGETDEGGTC